MGSISWIHLNAIVIILHFLALQISDRERIARSKIHWLRPSSRDALEAECTRGSITFSVCAQSLH